MEFNVIATQITMLAIAMLIGFVSIKSKYLEANTKNYISRVIVRITLPLLNYTSLTNRELNLEMLQKAGLVFLLAIISIILLYIFGALSAKVARIKGATATIHTCMTTFGNVAFIGYPLISSIFGSTGLFYAIIFTFVNDISVWTIGVIQISKSGTGAGKVNFKSLLNPNTIAFCLSILTIISGFRLPSILQETFTSIGSLTTYLSMLFIGMTLACVDLRDIYKRLSILLIVAVRMLALPALSIIIMSKLRIDPLLAGVVAMQIATPCGTVATIIASEYKSDFKYAAECVFITTTISLFTLPLIYALVNYLT